MKFLFLMSLTLFSATNLFASEKATGKKESLKEDEEVKKCLKGDFTGNIDRCIAIIYAGAITKEGPKPDRASPADNAFECTKNSSVTQDWEACRKAIKTYTTLVGLEKAMQTTSGIQNQIAQQKIQKEVSQKAAEGNLQTAALEAVAQQNKSNAAILHQQMLFYGSQGAALEAQVKAWPTQRKTVCKKQVDKSTLTVMYKQAQENTPIQKKPDGKGGFIYSNLAVGSGPTGIVMDTKFQVNSGNEVCNTVLKKLTDSDLFPNDTARAVLQAKAMEALSKAVAAGIDANKLKQNAAKAETLANVYNEDTADAMVELCAVDPTNVKCKTSGTRVNQAAYQAGDFNIGGNGVGQAFNLNPNGATAEEIGNAGTVGPNNVADITSPFADEAAKSSELLDRAGGASYTSAGAGGGGGGGVGGGGGGGGSAALGGDLQGADKDNKEAEIKTSKRDGGYSEAAGGGFQAMGSPSHDDENPLQSLFDQEGAKGGIEEDRSIASEDIDNSNSALFEKISKKYVKVHGEKRIEANNLE